MTFNGERKSWLILLEGREKSPFAPQNNNLLRVPEKPGAYIESTDTGVLYITQPIGFMVEDDADALAKQDELSSWLITDEPVPLEFDNEPGRTYYVKIDGDIPDFNRVANLRRGTITFVCPDPYGYGEEQGPYLFENDAITIENKGTAEAYPIIETTALQKSTSFMVAKGEEDFFMIGQPYDVDLETIEQFPQVAFYPMDSTNGWSPITEGFFFDDEVSGGTVTNGTITAENGRFGVSSYGTSQPGWHGPAVRRSLPKDMEDFSMTFGVGAFNNGNGIGKVMALLLDDNDDIVASIGLLNTRLGSKNIRVLVRMNDGDNIRRHRVMDYPGDEGNESTVFSGSPLNIQLRREGDHFYARTWQVRDGVPHARHSEDIIDDTVEFQRPVRQVALFFAKYEDNPVFNMYTYGFRVKDNNTRIMDEDQIPYIVEKDDKIVINTKEEVVMINDEPVTDLKAFGANYFMLDKGGNHLFTFPEGYFDSTIKWIERFK
ncbi:distal tail protein Dit [Gracilibacillus halophilus]|nr:distal tail protein Dit [Gracilibacillus halophilus]